MDTFFSVVPAATLLKVFLILDNICHNMILSSNRGDFAVTCSFQFISTGSLGEILTDLLRHHRVCAAQSSTSLLQEDKRSIKMSQLFIL